MPPNPLLEWPPEQVEVLRTARERGLSARKIAGILAAQFGITRSRSAVIGKLFRLREEGARPPKLPRAPKAPVRLKIEAGVRYGKHLVSVEEVPITGCGQLWRFRCDYGNEIVRPASKVKGGSVNSCGCGRRRTAHP
jgi:GcrA cell cycle regulator